MITVQEVTEWSDNTPNHKYILSDNRMKAYGYIKQGTDVPELFKVPMAFNASRRKFVVLVRTKDVEVDTSRTWKITGSRGDIYNVSLLDGKYTCTCPSATFRGQLCKHIKQIQEEQPLEVQSK